MARIEEEATPIRCRAANQRPSRYNSAVRHVAVITGVLLACGHPATTGPTTGGRPSGGTGTPTGGGTARSLTDGTGSGTVPVGTAKDLGCPAPSCAFHAGAGAYFTCTSSGGGSCFHYGPACTPADACMFDPGDRTYKQCAKSSEGTCQQWGAACAPATKCMFSPQDGYHHQCDEVSGGTCKRYGAFCAP